MGGAAVLVVALVVWFMVWEQGEKQVAAGEALSQVSASHFTPGPHPGAAEAYLKVAAAYPSSDAGARALLLAAGTLFSEGKYDDAKAQFQKFVREHSDSPFLGQALLGIASCLDAQGNADAAGAYKDLVDHHSGDVAVPQAKFALARLYEAQNKPDLAHTLYEDVEHTDPYGMFGPEAGMRAAELEIKFPNLAAKPATPPAAPAPTLKLQNK